METILQARDEGKIRHIGFSAHSHEAALRAFELFRSSRRCFPSTSSLIKRAILAIRSWRRRKKKARRVWHSKRWHVPTGSPTSLARIRTAGTSRWTIPILQNLPCDSLFPNRSRRQFLRAIPDCSAWHWSLPDASSRSNPPNAPNSVPTLADCNRYLRRHKEVSGLVG